MKDNQLVVETKGLTKSFSGKEVIQNCNMTVEKGTIYGFLGKNGAGKTTMFKLLLGLLQPTMGSAAVLGLDSVSQNLEILKNTGSLIETPIFYEHLPAKENLQIHLDYMGLDYSSIDWALNIVGLNGISDQPVSTFSLGMRQRLGIARALVHKPELLILDEPINGLDPYGIKEMRQLFLELVNQRGITLLISSHILSEMEQIADKIGFISDGTIVEEITKYEMQQRHPDGLEDYFMQITSGGKRYE